jgi:hypothetical protein
MCQQVYRQEVTTKHPGEETHVLLAVHHVSHACVGKRTNEREYLVITIIKHKCRQITISHVPLRVSSRKCMCLRVS